MKIYFLIILLFSLKVFGQTKNEPLFTREQLRHPLKVKELDLSHKRLKELPPELIKFKNLEDIDIDENWELDLFKAIKLLSKFKKLKSLSFNDIDDSIPNNISTLTNIEELYFEKRDLTSIPEGVKKLPKLRKLVLWQNKINKISLQSGDFPSLEEIDLGLNELTVFPDDLSLIPNLKRISFYENSISYISPAIKKLIHLEELDLRGNKLSSLPKEFGELKKLKKLDLLENQLSSITPLLSLVSIEELNIANNTIEELPEKIGMLKNLRKLYIGGNKIQVIPNNINLLANLKELHLSSNPLKGVPEQITNLQSLTYIDIDGTDSAKLPAYLSLLATLSKLQTLNISMGSVKEMPVEFGKLTQVKTFGISGFNLSKNEKIRIKSLFTKASFIFFTKSWGDASFYKYKPCSMDENSWDTITINNIKLKYLFIRQGYKYTDEFGIHHWDGEILLNLDKKLVDKETTEKILIVIADRLQIEDIIAAKTCRTFDIMHSAMPPKNEEEKNYYKENFIGKYYRKQGVK